MAGLAAELDRLNAAYEARFGFRYCVFVAGRSRAELLPGIDAALDADRDAEIHRALDAVVDIARDRYATLTAAAGGGHDMIELGANRYGKAAIRLVRVARGADGDRVRDLTVAIALEGDFDAAHTDGDNAQRRRDRHDEEHGLRVRQGPPRRGRSRTTAGRSPSTSSRSPQVDRRDRQHPRPPLARRSTSPARRRRDAFVRGGEGTRVATIAASRGGHDRSRPASRTSS